MTRTFAALVLLIGTSGAFAAPAAPTSASRLSETDARELTYVVQTLEQARRCGFEPASYAAMSRFLELSREMQVKTNKVPAAEVDALIKRARATTRPFEMTQCNEAFKQLPAANATFVNLNKTLESLNAVEASLKE